jgi:hypothetical protein|tara:strand:- start:1039 stop:1875 length:837 start_codon:yes stop_codon:yes gene_type:complete
MATPKHSKYKNTGLLFELLVRQITADTMNDTNSPAITILKKYFVNTELGKEYRLYEQLGNYKNQSETKSEIIISSLLEASAKLNRSEVKKQRYNLIKEVRNKYSEEKFFKVKVNNYKIYAAFNNLVENQSNKNITPEDTIHNKLTLLEHLIKPIATKPADTLMEEYKEYPKDVKILTHRIMLEKFNDKYEHLLPEQRNILREVVTSIDNTSKLRDFYNTKITEVREKLTYKLDTLEDKVIKIKIQEVLKYISPVEKTRTVSDENIINLLQYYELDNAL